MAQEDQIKKIEQTGYIFILKEKPILDITASYEKTIDAIEAQETAINQKLTEEQQAAKTQKYALPEDIEKQEEKIQTLEATAGLLDEHKEKIRTEEQQKIQEQKTKIEQQQQNFKNKLQQKISLITGNAANEPKKIVMEEYKWTLNGFALDISKEEAEQLRNLPEVDRIEPDYHAQATLLESIPMIKADAVWKLDADGQQCATSGKQCLTGKNIKIAVLDTGIDYTHPDFGACTKELLQTKQCAKIINGENFLVGKCQKKDPADPTKCLQFFPYTDQNDPMDDEGHGTHVAGTIAGNGALKGTAPDAQIIAFKVLGAEGSGPSSAIIAAIEKSFDPNKDGNTEDKYDIISMSLGITCGDPDDPVSEAVDRAVANGVVAVVAAGNDGRLTAEQMAETCGCGPLPAEDATEQEKTTYTNCAETKSSQIGSPGSARRAITIGSVCDKKYQWQAVDPKDGLTKTYTICKDGPESLSTFSSRGPTNPGRNTGIRLDKPDLVAPGQLITATWPAGINCNENVKNTPFASAQGYCAIQGTSMATPHVSGLIALMLQHNPSLTPAQLKQTLTEKANKIGLTDVERKNKYGAGLIDAIESVGLSLTTPAPTAEPTSTLSPTPAPTIESTPTPEATLTPSPSPTPTEEPPIPPGFGPPYNLFETDLTTNFPKTIIEQIPEIEANPEELYIKDVQITAKHPNGWIWKEGYRFDAQKFKTEQNPWVQFIFDQQTYGNTQWIPDEADTTLKQIPLESIRLDTDYANAVLVFSCKKQEGKWRCGCTEEEKTNDATPCGEKNQGRWMIRQYTVNTETPPITPTEPPGIIIPSPTATTNNLLQPDLIISEAHLSDQNTNEKTQMTRLPATDAEINFVQAGKTVLPHIVFKNTGKTVENTDSMFIDQKIKIKGEYMPTEGKYHTSPPLAPTRFKYYTSFANEETKNEPVYIGEGTALTLQQDKIYCVHGAIDNEGPDPADARKAIAELNENNNRATFCVKT